MFAAAHPKEWKLFFHSHLQGAEPVNQTEAMGVCCALRNVCCAVAGKDR
jgi:hypothetical protein